MRRCWLLVLVVIALVPCRTFAGPPRPLQMRVAGLPREGLIFLPETGAAGAPLVFIFHGHGGNVVKAAEGFAIHDHWPDAVCVYLQGVPTPAGSDPQGKKPGWQKDAGDFGDRDLLFFDAVLDRMKQQYKVDAQRVYATGFSNGGFFTYLLWAERGEALAAAAVIAAHPGKQREHLKAKPYLHIAGETDALVAFDLQQKAVASIRQLNGCDENGEMWNNGRGRAIATIYKSQGGMPVVDVTHSGGHEVPVFAGRILARFFREQGRE